MVMHDIWLFLLKSGHGCWPLWNSLPVSAATIDIFKDKLAAVTLKKPYWTRIPFLIFLTIYRYLCHLFFTLLHPIPSSVLIF